MIFCLVYFAAKTGHFWQNKVSTEFEAQLLLLNLRTSIQPKNVLINFPTMYCVSYFEAAKTSHSRKMSRQIQHKGELWQKSYEYLQTLCK